MDSTGFEEWATRERERLRLAAMEALDALITGCLAQAEYAKGIAAATRLIAMDPLREETHRQMMDLLWRSGQRGKALEQYDTLCRVLDEEFGVTPLPETVALYEQLRAGDLPLPELPPPKRPFYHQRVTWSWQIPTKGCVRSRNPMPTISLDARRWSTVCWPG